MLHRAIYAGIAFKVLLLGAMLFPAEAASADPVMERVNKTQTLRCGYVPYPPGIIKDPNTGKMSDYDVEIMDEIGRRTKLKIEWTAETNWPVYVADLTTNKYDVLCVGYWANPKNARFALSTIPVTYEPTYLITRADDTRFDGGIGVLNDPKIKLAVLDGDVPDALADELFPKVGRVNLSQQTSFSQVFEEVATKRADVTMSGYADATAYIKNNPTKPLKIVTAHPVRLYSKAMQVHPDGVGLQQMLNLTIHEMQLDGTIERIMKKYATSPHEFFLVEWGMKPLVK